MDKTNGQTAIFVHLLKLIIVRLQNTGSTEFTTWRPWAVEPQQSEDATKGLRVINSVDPSVLKSNFFRL